MDINRFFDNMLCRLLIRYKNRLLKMPFTSKCSRIIDCIECLLDELGGGRNG
jgi:hypothetical protein